MASDKTKSLIVKKLRLLKAKPANQEEILSDIWYTNKEVWDVLDISPATCKRWRKKDWLKTSKRPGKGSKIYFNAKHVHDLLKGGLPKVIILSSAFLEFTDFYDLLPGVA